MAKKYKCPYCNERYIRKDLIAHIDEDHEDLIPNGFESAQVVYDTVNGTKGAGKCRVCGRPTKWSSSSKRYDVLCNNSMCKQKMREEYQKNMLRVHGTYNILTSDEQQKKMLANRSISGKYKFTDGGVITYTGSYEKKFLEFADKVMQIPSKDIMAPGPTIEYEMNGEKHFYITDFLYIPYNLIIEVKDGGSNPNNKNSVGMQSSRQRTIEKEKLITDRGEYNYLRLTDNQFVQLLEIFMDIKKALIEGIDDKIVRINESYLEEESQLITVLKRIPEIKPHIRDTINKIKSDKDRRLAMINNRFYLSSYKRLIFNKNNANKFSDQNKALEKYCEIINFDNVNGYIYLDNNKFVASVVTIKEDNDIYIDSIIINKGYIAHGLLHQLIDVATIDLGATVVNLKITDITEYQTYTKSGFVASEKLDDGRIKMVNSKINTRNGSTKKPIFIVTSYNHAEISKIIATVTNSFYSHASISTKSDLSELYSYGVKNRRIVGTGIKKEKLKEFAKKDSIIRVNCIFVNSSDYNNINNKIQDLYNNRNKTHYNFAGILDIISDCPRDTTDDMICSQFTYHILNNNGIKLFDKSENLITPDDLSRLCDTNNRVYKLYDGLASNFNTSLINDRIEYLSTKAYTINESCIIESTDVFTSGCLNKYKEFGEQRLNELIAEEFVLDICTLSAAFYNNDLDIDNEVFDSLEDDFIFDLYQESSFFYNNDILNMKSKNSTHNHCDKLMPLAIASIVIENYLNEDKKIDNKSEIENIIDVATDNNLPSSNISSIDLEDFKAYHLEPKIAGRDKNHISSWDEELYYKTIDDAINDIKDDYEVKERDSFEVYVYTAGKNLKPIYMGIILIRDKNDPSDWEWIEQESISYSDYEYLKKEPMVEAFDISNFYDEEYDI